MNLYRTVGPKPLTVLEHLGQYSVFPWEDLLDLRRLIAEGGGQRGAWAVTDWRITRTRKPLFRRVLYLSEKDMEQLRRLLYVDSPLISVVDAAARAHKPRQRIQEAIETGRLFAFLVPGRRRRRWLVPVDALLEWMKQYGK